MEFYGTTGLRSTGQGVKKNIGNHRRSSLVNPPSPLSLGLLARRKRRVNGKRKQNGRQLENVCMSTYRKPLVRIGKSISFGVLWYSMRVSHDPHDHLTYTRPVFEFPQSGLWNAITFSTPLEYALTERFCPLRDPSSDPGDL